MRKLLGILTFLLILPVLGTVLAGPHEQAEAIESKALEALDARNWRVAENRFRSLLTLTDTNRGADVRLVRCLLGLGKALVLQGEAGESRALFERGLRVLGQLDEPDTRLEAEALHGLARGALLERKTGRARYLLMRERALRDEWAGEEPLALARSLRELGRLNDSETHPGIAVSWVGHESGLYEQGLREGQLVVPSDLDQVARDADRGVHAFKLSYLRAVAVAGDPWPNEAALADALRGIAQAYANDDQPGESSKWFEQAWLIRPPVPFTRALEAFFMFRDPKALAIGLDSDGRWVYGFAVGSKSEEEAVKWALARCERRTAWGQVHAGCRIYALHDEIVWKAGSGVSGSLVPE